MMTVKDVFGVDVSEVSEEQILRHLENCLVFTEDVDEATMAEFPKEWETLLWKHYTKDDIIKKYEEDYNEAMRIYYEAKEYNCEHCFFVYDCLKKAFIEGWKTKMVLKWADEGYFNENQREKIKRMFFDIAMIG